MISRAPSRSPGRIGAPSSGGRRPERLDAAITRPIRDHVSPRLFDGFRVTVSRRQALGGSARARDAPEEPLLTGKLPSRRAGLFDTGWPYLGELRPAGLPIERCDPHHSG